MFFKNIMKHGSKENNHLDSCSLTPCYLKAWLDRALGNLFSGRRPRPWKGVGTRSSLVPLPSQTILRFYESNTKRPSSVIEICFLYTNMKKKNHNVYTGGTVPPVSLLKGCVLESREHFCDGTFSTCPITKVAPEQTGSILQQCNHQPCYCSWL